MTETEPFKAHRIAVRILDKLKKKKAQLARHDSLSAFIGWVLELYADGKFEEAKPEAQTTGSLIVAAGAERMEKRDERKRKAS